MSVHQIQVLVTFEAETDDPAETGEEVALSIRGALLKAIKDDDFCDPIENVRVKFYDSRVRRGS